MGEYDARYWSVGAHRPGGPGPHRRRGRRGLLQHPPPHDDDAAPTLPWWTVNARMLNATADARGVGYVFFVPDADALALQASQGKEDWDAPELAWGSFARGRVLGEPDMIYFRYRAPADGWEGN